MNNAFDDLMAFQRETGALGQIAGRLGWDQETMMPRGAAPQRAEEMAAMEHVLHARRTDPRMGEWLAAIDDKSLDQVGQANLRHIRKSYLRNTAIPAKLASELARKTSMAQGIWAEARSKDDFASFAPTLEEIVSLKREEAAALSKGNLYDALLDDYEPDATGDQIAAMFNAMEPRLIALRDKVLGKPEPKNVTGTFDEAKQMKLTRQLAKTFGYDMSRGRVDKAVHPFSSGSGMDVRITTRTSEIDPFNCFYSTIHEVGHACYEQNINDDYLFTPLGSGVSMGVHESQSRIYENQIGRGRAFTSWLFGEMKEVFGDFGIANQDEFYATVNKVHKGYIRTEADEIQYNLHVLLRFGLEKDLIEGKLDVADLEEAWNTRFEQAFGYKVDKASNGVLQDVHWSVGLFGYFPTYSLGNLYAGCLNVAMRGALPDLDADLAKGDTTAATAWLQENVQQHGGLYKPTDLIAKATGAEPSETPLMDYLEAKFCEIYDL